MISMHGVEVTAFKSFTMIKFIGLYRTLFIGRCSKCDREVYNCLTFLPECSEADRDQAIEGGQKRWAKNFVCNECTLTEGAVISFTDDE